MKYVCLLCLVTIFAIPLYSAEETKAKEPRKPTWIERVFGIGDDDTDEEVEEVAEEATEEGASKEKAKKPKESEKANKPAARKFTEEDREVLESWQKGNASWKKSKKPKKKLPPGLQKKVDRGGELPPGWKKKLEVGTVLDPEVDAVAEPLPEDILKRLPESEEGAEIIRVGQQIIKVIEGSREIVDIIDGAVSDSSDKD